MTPPVPPNRLVELLELGLVGILFAAAVGLLAASVRLAWNIGGGACL